MREREGPAELLWDPEERIGVLRFVEEGVGGRREAERLSVALDEWVGDEPYGLLVDCSEIVDADAGWRATWGEYFKANRDQATLAWFNANARVRLIILMFRKGTAVHGRSFDSIDDAREWLRSELHGGET